MTRQRLGVPSKGTVTSILGCVALGSSCECSVHQLSLSASFLPVLRIRVQSKEQCIPELPSFKVRETLYEQDLSLVRWNT